LGDELLFIRLNFSTGGIFFIHNVESVGYTPVI
jgi:hypothetical protein